MMITKSSAEKIISDFCQLIKNQTSGFTLCQILQTVSYFYCAKISPSAAVFPELVLGDDMKSVYIKLQTGNFEKLNEKNFRICVDYVDLITDVKNIKAI